MKKELLHSMRTELYFLHTSYSLLYLDKELYSYSNTSHKYKTQTGEQKEEVCFLEFSVFGKQAEILNQYVRKGSKVMLEGRLVLEQWTAI